MIDGPVRGVYRAVLRRLHSLYPATLASAPFRVDPNTGSVTVNAAQASDAVNIDVGDDDSGHAG